MTESRNDKLQDDSYSGDFSVTPTQFAEAQSAEQGAPSMSHEVIASYVADAARSVQGVADLHVSPWKGLSSWVRETHSGGVVIKDTGPGAVDIEIHVVVPWGTVIPDLARGVDAAVRDRVTAFLNIQVDSVTLYVDDITEPAEVGGASET